MATGTVLAGAIDVAAAEHAQIASAAGTSQWSAYAEGAPAAAGGGRGVSKPPRQALAHARQTPDAAATAPQGTTRAVELVHSSGLDR